MATEYLCRTSDMVIGPMSLMAVRDLWQRGMLTADDQYCEAGKPWQAVGALLITAGGTVAAVADSPTEPPASRFLYNNRIETSQAGSGVVSPERSVGLPPLMPAAPISSSTPDSPLLGVRISTTAGHASNRQIQQLIAEYVSQQKPTGSQLREPLARPSRSVGVWAMETIHRAMTPLKSTCFLLGGMAGILVKSRSVWAAVSLVMFIEFAPRLSMSVMTPEQARQKLAATFDEWKELRTQHPDEATWEEFQERSLVQLSEMVPRLESLATPREPTSMSLLWTTRDYLPPLIVDPEQANDASIARVETHLQRIESAHLRAALAHPPWSGWTEAIIGFDVVLVLAVIFWCSRNSRARSQAELTTSAATQAGAIQ